MAVAEGRSNEYFLREVAHHTKVEWDDEVLKEYVNAYLTKRLYSSVGCTEKQEAGAWFDLVVHVAC